jgi:hypothetical protein
MPIVTFPSTASPIKSIQRGVAVSSGNITITSVLTSKTTVKSFSNGSTGSVSIAGSNTSGANITISGAVTGGAYANTNQTSSGLGGTGGNIFGGSGSNSQTYFNGSNISADNWAVSNIPFAGGTTNIVSKEYGAYLLDSTTITVTGPCRYEVIEYY